MRLAVRHPNSPEPISPELMMNDEPCPTPQVFRAAERKAVPWKNGGGVTSEIAAFPPGSGLDEFGWRISTAEVAAAGPFSMFEGVDRILTVLQGKIALRFAAKDSEVVIGCGQSLAFAGDVAVNGVPLGSPVRDLNVMVRRGAWQAEVTSTRPQSSGNETLIAIATQSASGLVALDAVQLAGDQQLPADFVGLYVCLRPARYNYGDVVDGAD